MRRIVARAFRRAVAGSLVLALLAIAIATWGAVGLQHSEAGAAPPSDDDTAAAIEVEATAAPVVAEFDLRPPVVEVAPTLSDQIESPTSEATSRVAAIGQLAGPPPQTLSIDEPEGEGEGEETVEQASVPLDPNAVEEPLPFVVSGGNTGSPPLAPGDVIAVTVSFYYCEVGDSVDGGDGGGFCGPMRDGTVVYEGAAACALTYLGQRFRIVGDPTERIYTCHDTGSAVHGLHRDIFFHYAADGWPWLAAVGTDVVLEIVE